MGEARKISLVAGLGNPGKAYEKTRHNFGFAVLDELAKEGGASWKLSSFSRSEIAKNPQGIWLLKPMSFMNCSGSEIQKAIKWLKVPVEEVLIVVDDVQLPLGKFRLRKKGSSGGHNGLKSIEQSLKTQEYSRLRGGVGLSKEEASEHQNTNLKKYVLGTFSNREWKIIEQMVDYSKSIIYRCCEEGIDAAANIGNRSVIEEND